MNPRSAIHPLIWNRHEDFNWVFAFEGLDLTGATITGGIRTAPDAPGAPVVTLGMAGSPTAQGFRLQSVSSEDVFIGGAAGTLTAPVSYVSLRILEAVADGFTYPIEVGEDLVLFWDMHIQPSGGDDYRQLEGPFTVHLGARVS
jgi:hypothetical protein